MIEWADFKFPPINLWSYPLNTTLYFRYESMYCADELNDYYMYRSIADLERLKKAKAEFQRIWEERHEYWEKVNK